jgi:hypothetical protein
MESPEMTAATPAPADPIPTTLATEPARAFGYTGSVVGLIIAIVVHFVPLSSTIQWIISMGALLLIPVVIAELTRLKVFSPATVDFIKQVLQGQIDTSTTISQNAVASATANQAALNALQTVVAEGLQSVLGGVLTQATAQATTAATSAQAAARLNPPTFPFGGSTGAPAPQQAAVMSASRVPLDQQQWNQQVSRHQA